jgi:hypothetical protein
MLSINKLSSLSGLDFFKHVPAVLVVKGIYAGFVIRAAEVGVIRVRGVRKVVVLDNVIFTD